MLLSLATYDIFNDRIKQLYRQNSFKILIFVICLVGWLNKEAYNGGLISSLIHQRYESEINKLEDILYHPSYQLVLRKGTASVQYFEDSEEWPHKQLWESQLKNKTVAYVDRILDAESLLLKEKKYVYFDIISKVERIFESYPCNIIRSQNTYFQRPVALAFKKNSHYLGLFNHKLGQYKESGIIANMVSLKESPKGVVTCPSYKNIAIGYESVFSAFVVFTMGLMLSVVYLIFEVMYKKYFVTNRVTTDIHDTRKQISIPNSVKDKAINLWIASAMDAFNLKEIPSNILKDIYKLNNQIIEDINRKLCTDIQIGSGNDATQTINYMKY